MATAPPGLAELARRIVEQEAGGSSDPAASVAAVERACRRLKEHLVDVLGSGGVAALLGRALHMATRDQPLLARVSMSEEPGACFSGLAESLADATDEEATAAAILVLTRMLDLLVILFGDELGMKPIRTLWPRTTRVGRIRE